MTMLRRLIIRAIRPSVEAIIAEREAARFLAWGPSRRVEMEARAEVYRVRGEPAPGLDRQISRLRKDEARARSALGQSSGS